MAPPPVTPDEIRRVLDVDGLLDDARREAGLDDFGGDPAFVESLAAVRECFASDTRFSTQGLHEFRTELVRNLVNRLRYTNDLKLHPEIAEEDVSDPIIILGLGRSGTTKTHRMIGTDPSLLKTYMWQLLNPAPFPGDAPGDPEPRIHGAIKSDSIFEKNPQLHAAQYFAQSEIHEDVWLLGLTFNSGWQMTWRAPCPSFAAWARGRTRPSDLDNYRFMGGLFQYLQWQQGGRQGRKWLLKNTGTMSKLDEVLAVHPNATLVHVHRHPRYSIPSIAKLFEHAWRLRITDADPVYAGRYCLERTRWEIDGYLEQRDRLGLDGRIIDVPYEQIRSDPFPAVRKIYERAGHEFTPAAEQGMRQWELDNEQGKRGRHVYDMAEMGLSDEEIDATFGAYIERFRDYV